MRDILPRNPKLVSKRFKAVLFPVILTIVLSASHAFATRVLLVVGGSTPSIGELMLKDRLAQRGFAVLVRNTGELTLANAVDKDLIIISESVVSTGLKALLRDVHSPIICFEPYQFDDLGMTEPEAGRSYGSVDEQQNVVITKPGHPLAASLDGVVEVAERDISMGFGVPGTNAIPVATLINSPDMYAIFAYKAGSRMPGLVAPGIRIGYYMPRNAPVSMTSDGWKLFDAAVVWAMTPALPSIPPTPAGKRTLVFYNNCSTKIWVGGSGSVPNCSSCDCTKKDCPQNPLKGDATGFELPSTPNRNTKIILVPNNLQSMNFWARTGCRWETNQSWTEKRFICSTGDCGNGSAGFNVPCNGGTKAPPANSWEGTLNPSTGFWNHTGLVKVDYYDLTNVDGYSRGIKVEPLKGRFKKVSPWNEAAKYNCGKPSCTFDMAKCPPELSATDRDGKKVCWSLCKAVSDPGQRSKHKVLQNIYNNPDTRAKVCCACDCGANCGCDNVDCKYGCSPYNSKLPNPHGGICHYEQWPKPDAAWCKKVGLTDANCNYAKIYKSQCPDAYSWQFNDGESTYQCKDADYLITFCPSL
jgi:hypothetical protein